MKKVEKIIFLVVIFLEISMVMAISIDHTRPIFGTEIKKLWNQGPKNYQVSIEGGIGICENKLFYSWPKLL